MYKRCKFFFDHITCEKFHFDTVRMKSSRDQYEVSVNWNLLRSSDSLHHQSVKEVK